MLFLFPNHQIVFSLLPTFFKTKCNMVYMPLYTILAFVLTVKIQCTSLVASYKV